MVYCQRYIYEAIKALGSRSNVVKRTRMIEYIKKRYPNINESSIKPAYFCRNTKCGRKTAGPKFMFLVKRGMYRMSDDMTYSEKKELKRLEKT